MPSVAVEIHRFLEVIGKCHIHTPQKKNIYFGTVTIFCNMKYYLILLLNIRYVCVSGQFYNI